MSRALIILLGIAVTLDVALACPSDPASMAVAIKMAAQRGYDFIHFEIAFFSAIAATLLVSRAFAILLLAIPILSVIAGPICDYRPEAYIDAYIWVSKWLFILATATLLGALIFRWKPLLYRPMLWAYRSWRARRHVHKQ